MTKKTLEQRCTLRRWWSEDRFNRCGFTQFPKPCTNENICVAYINGKPVLLAALKGDQGIPGVPGEPGYTPVKGVDYYTPADKDAFKTEVLGDIERATMPTKRYHVAYLLREQGHAENPPI